MTVSISLGHNSDGYLESSSTNYGTALGGSNVLVPGSSAPLMFYGQSVASGVRYIFQSFVRTDFTVDADTTPVAAYLRVQAGSTAGAGTARDLEVRPYNWGASVTAGNWRTPAQLNSLGLAGRVVGAHQAGSSIMRAGLGLGEVAASGQKRYVVCSSRNRLQQAPSGLEWQTLRQAESSNTVTQRPALFVTSTTKHLLDLSLGGQVQLSDGTHMLLVQSATAGNPTLLDLVHHDGVSATTVFSGDLVEGRVGAQAYSMCRDEHDNVYVLNRSGVTSRMNARAYIKGQGHSWTPGHIATAALPSYDGHINNVSCAWHPQGGTAGTIVAVAACEAGSNAGAQAVYALVNVDHLLTGAGSSLRGSGNATGTVIDAPAPSGFNNYSNETGTLLDVCAVRDASGQVSDRGYVLSTAQSQVLGSRTAQSTARYQLNASGTAISTVRTMHSVSGFSVKDADAKSRVLPVSRTQFCTVNASDSSGFGIVVKHFQQSSGSSFDVLADARLDAQSITSMPDPSDLATSSAWDALYDPTTNLVWVYYLDQADGRRLMKTHVDLNSGLAAADEVEVATDVGAAGSTNHAIRVHRGESSGQGVLISVANETSGGTHELLLVSEIVNLPPDAPNRQSKTNFDADDPAAFVWEFRDPNPSDTQSAYQVQVWDDTTDTIVHDTTKTTSGNEFHEVAGSTLTNGEEYRWRVRTWDSFDEEGPWSSFGFFATSASGNVTIIWPDTDNPEGIETADVQIEWEVTGADQDEYRVVVVRTSNEAVHSDTGWVESTDTVHLVQGLASETEYRVEVTIRDTMVASSTGTRLVTPDYTSPVEPVVTTTPVSDGAYIRVAVENPVPGEVLSTLDGTFEDGVTGWVPEPRTTLVGAQHQLGFGSSTTVSVPGGVQDGDLMFLAAASNFDETITPPAGWSLQESTIWGSTGGSDQHGLWVYTRIADSEPGSYDITWGGSQWHSAAIVVVRPAVDFNSWDVATVDSDVEVDSPTVMAQVGDWVVLFGHTAESGTRTVDPGMTVVSNPDRGVFVAYQVLDEVGASPVFTLANDGTANAMAAGVLRLDEAVRFTASTEQVFGGAQSGRLEVSGTPGSAGVRPDVGWRVEVEPHRRYTAAMWVYRATTGPVRAVIDFFDEDDVHLSTTHTETVVDAEEWTLVEHSVSAPVGAAWAGYGPTLDAPSDGQILFVDGVELRTATDVPTPAGNEIWRADNGGTAVLLATIDPGDSYRDYLTGAGRVYTYTARAVAPDGAATWSAPVTDSVYFLGVWIHDPTDAEGTIDQYLYGRAQRSDSRQVEQVSHHFVGRPNPVTCFGEHRTDTWDITVDVPEGPDRLGVTDRLREWAAARRTLVGRDNRGRVWISTMDAFDVGDTDWGESVSWTMTRVSSDLPGGER